MLCLTYESAYLCKYMALIFFRFLLHKIPEFFRLNDMLCSTYESASTRRFTYGRVDSIRASHPEALVWAKSMLDKSKTKDEKKELFKEAISKQTKIMKENIFGEGENKI